MKQSLIQKNIDHQLTINSFVASNDGAFTSNELMNKISEDAPPPSLLQIEKNHSSNIALVIEKSSDKIAYALQHPPEAQILPVSLITAIISTFFAATASFVYNWLHWRMVNKKDRCLKVVESLVEIVAELRSDSVNYWLKNYSHRESKDVFDEEMRIKSSLKIINSSIDDYLSRVPKRDRKKIESPIRSYHNELFDIITGGDFESQERKVDKAKAAQISNKCVSFRVYMSSLKA
ncbi:hypothetical protein [Lonsdalea quercina]|uniref:hypothetical protein n=1 Tax=Lonsdalea quercina TaxID=71657 RepID=UPI003974FE31